MCQAIGCQASATENYSLQFGGVVRDLCSFRMLELNVSCTSTQRDKSGSRVLLPVRSIFEALRAVR